MGRELWEVMLQEERGKIEVQFLPFTIITFQQLNTAKLLQGLVRLR